MPKQNLTEFVEAVTGDTHLRVEDDLGDGFFVLRVSEAERRQARHDVRSTEDIVIEMLRNARDAHARNIFLAMSREGSQRRLCMIDDGDGIPAHLHKRIFDARVTSKLDSVHVDAWGVHGRGMALYAVRLNSKSAYVVASQLGGGSAFVIETDTTVLPEKADQSSQPTFLLNESGTVVVRGPRNINRTVAEFAYVDRESCSVYLGSPVEIAATLWEFGRLLLPASTRAFCSDVDEVELCKRLALASDPAQFCLIAAGLGLAISERSARRIMDGSVSGLPSVADSINVNAADGKPAPTQKGRSRTKGTCADMRTLKLSDADKTRLRDAVKTAFSALADQYYLEPDVEVSLSVRRDGIYLKIPVEKIR